MAAAVGPNPVLTPAALDLEAGQPLIPDQSRNRYRALRILGIATCSLSLLGTFISAGMSIARWHVEDIAAPLFVAALGAAVPALACSILGDALGNAPDRRLPDYD